MKRGSCTHPEGEVPTGRTGPGCFFGLDGGGKKEEKTTRGAALLFGVTRRLRPSPARGLGAGGAAVPSTAPARSGVPRSPPAWPGARRPHNDARRIPYTFMVLAMGHEWWRGGTTPGSVGLRTEPVLVTSARPRFASPPPHCSGFAAGAGEGGGHGAVVAAPSTSRSPGWWGQQQQGGSCAEASAAVT